MPIWCAKWASFILFIHLFKCFDKKFKHFENVLEYDTAWGPDEKI